ncbi:MAG: protein kinase [Bdellovibrionales bacterium]|nr:protein kinase [Bdellovibrionales bacterium]
MSVWGDMDTTVGEDLSMFAPGTRIARRYEIQKHLGAGGMGIVVQAIDRALDNEAIALKFLYPHLVKDQVLFARFRNEVLLTRRLAHPNIVSLYDFGRSEGGYFFISMEYIEGQNLRKRIHDRKKDRLKFGEVVKILHDIASGLAHAHSRGVIHRDLKPDNILISDFGEVKVMDFGLARSLWIDKGLTETGNAVGTPQYMAPEQIRGDDLDVRCDIYSLGIMAYEMVTGDTPFNAEGWYELAAQHLREPIPSFATKENGIPEWYEEMVFKCCEKDRSKRYASVMEFLEVLNEYKEESVDTNISYTPAVLSLYTKDVKRRRKRRWKRRARYAATMGAFAGAGLIVAGAIVGAVKYIQPVNQFVAGLVIQAEDAAGADLGAVKSMLGTNLTLDSKEFFERIAVEEVDAVKVLLQAGMSPDVRDSAGVSALERAIESGNEEMVRALLAGGADINEAPGGGKTPLMFAAEKGNAGAVYAILERRPHINARDDRGMTALMHAAANGNTKAVQAIADSGAYVNPKDAFGYTALMHAVDEGDAMAVRALLDKRADTSAVDEKGDSALIIAARDGNKEIAELLVNYGADTSVKNREGKKAVDYVSRRSDRELWNIVAKATPKKEKSVFVSKGDADSGSGSTELQQTRLRARGKPRGVWKAELGGTKLVSVEAKVKNVGSVTAEQVKVFVELPNGEQLKLSGPGSVERNETEVYTASVDKVVRSSDELRIVMECTNCRN